jgi:hypothetical protein
VTEGEARVPADAIGEYCRAVEDHLTRANAGHLVRIVGPGFELVRRWALAGVPLSIVFRGIDMKAERHREGRASRPLRIEFCEGDVRSVFDDWRRAIGVSASALAGDAGSEDPGLRPAGDPGLPSESNEARSLQTPGPTRRPSLSKHLDRAIDRLGRVGGRLDLPVALRDACDQVLQELAGLRASAAGARGEARDDVISQLGILDAKLAEAARQHAPAPLREPLAAQAVADLEPYRRRLSGEAWQRSVDVTTDRLLRDRLGLPRLEL